MLKKKIIIYLSPLYTHTHTHKMFLVPQLLLFYLSHVHFLKIIYSLRNLAINKKKIFIRAADTLKKTAPCPPQCYVPI